MWGFSLTKEFDGLRARLHEVFGGDGPAPLGRSRELDPEGKLKCHFVNARRRRKGLSWRRRWRHPQAETRVSGRCGRGSGGRHHRRRGLLLWNVQGEVSVAEERLEAAVDASGVRVVPAAGRIDRCRSELSISDLRFHGIKESHTYCGIANRSVNLNTLNLAITQVVK